MPCSRSKSSLVSNETSCSALGDSFELMMKKWFTFGLLRLPHTHFP